MSARHLIANLLAPLCIVAAAAATPLPSSITGSYLVQVNGVGDGRISALTINADGTAQYTTATLTGFTTVTGTVTPTLGGYIYDFPTNPGPMGLHGAIQYSDGLGMYTWISSTNGLGGTLKKCKVAA